MVKPHSKSNDVKEHLQVSKSATEQTGGGFYDKPEDPRVEQEDPTDQESLSTTNSEDSTDEQVEEQLQEPTDQQSISSTSESDDVSDDDFDENQAPEPASDEEWNRYVEVAGTQETELTKFGVLGVRTEFSLSEALAEIDDSIELLERLMQRLINKAIDRAQEHGYECSQINFTFEAEGMHSGEFSVPFRSPKENNARKLSAEMKRFQQSENGTTIFEKMITVSVTVVSSPVGEGARKLGTPVKGSNIDPKGLLIVPRTNDNICLFKALCLVIYYHKNRRNPHLARSLQLLAKNRKKLTKKAEELRKILGIEIQNTPYGLAHIEQIQKSLSKVFGKNKFNVIVFGQKYGVKPVFNGKMNAKHQLTLYHVDNHFHGAKSPSKLLGQRNYCVACEVPYERPQKHHINCPIRCRKCGKMGYGFPEKCGTQDDNVVATCASCRLKFYSLECYENHKKNVCGLLKLCHKCEEHYLPRGGHVCGEVWCRKCRSRHRKGDHKRKGFVEPLKKSKVPKKYRIVAYDFECIFDDPDKKNRVKHRVNAISAFVTCTSCMDNGDWEDLDKNNCEICGPEKKFYTSVWDSATPLSKFVEFLHRGSYPEDEKMRAKWIKYPTYAYAHNGSKYDTHFLLQEFYSRPGVEPKIINSGNKVFQARVGRTKTTATLFIRDSNLFFPMKLEQAPKTFSFLDKVKPKPFFPYRANREANYHRTLPTLPPKSDYIPNSMSKDTRLKFDKWYEDNYKTTFNLKHEIREYCTNDSLILLHALVTYRKVFNETAGTDVFIQGTTLTSLCKKFFQLNCLEENLVPIVPIGGYGRQDRQSRIALQWIEYLIKQHGITLQYRNSPEGEKEFTSKGKTFRVDAFVPATELQSPNFQHCTDSYNKMGCFLCEQQKQNPGLDLIIELNGCAWHGCGFCMKNEELCPNKKTSSENLEATEKRKRIIVDNFDVAFWSMQECILRKELKKNREMKHFFVTNTYDKGPLDPRDGFFGGRVHPTRMYMEPKDDEVIKYFDIVSLYPYVLMNHEFPVGGEPIRLFKKDLPGWQAWKKGSDLPFKGLYKVRIAPPDDLIFPVLPIRDDNRLVFSLCLACTKGSRKATAYREPGCDHTEEERAFDSTATHVELMDALDQGYKILDFVEGWKYNESQWSGDLFKKYMGEFLRLKIEASGWPEEILADTDPEKAKDEMIRIYKEKEQLDIRKEKVEKNEGLRYIAKLCANSLWGRFAMRPKDENKIVQSAAALNKLFGFRSRQVIAIIPINDEKLRVNVRHRNQFEEEDDFSNIVIAMYTTSYARQVLLKYMRQCEEASGGAKGAKLLYNDTDSVIALFKKDNIPLKSGEFLGDMKDEYPKHVITKFASGGSKNYVLKMVNEHGQEETKQKVRGITLNSQASDVLTPDKQEECVKIQPEVKTVKVPTTQFLRDPKSNVFSKETTKDYRVHVRKAWVDVNANDYQNYPYGYNPKNRRGYSSKSSEPPSKKQRFE